MLSPRLFSGLFGLVLVSIVLGCGKSEPTAANPPNTGGPPGPPMGGPPGPGGPGFAKANSGNDVFDQKCANCHSVGDPDATAGQPKGKKGGPNLSKAGADPAHTVDWLTAYIKDPKSQKPDSKMPKFEGKLDADQIKSVAEFLAAKK